jgi:hypothetical protein
MPLERHAGTLDDASASSTDARYDILAELTKGTS